MLGVLLVAVCALAGSRLMASADDTTDVWVARHAIVAGETMNTNDLAVAKVRFTTDESVRYLGADTTIAGRVATRPIGAGELVPLAATAERRTADRLEIPLAVTVGGAPADLAPGDLVDVWAVGRDQNKTKPSAVWRAVEVVSVESARGAVASAQRQVLIGMDASQTAALATGLQQLGSGTPVLVRRLR